jgi:HEPN domain-containing protein
MKAGQKLQAKLKSKLKLLLPFSSLFFFNFNLKNKENYGRVYKKLEKRSERFLLNAERDLKDREFDSAMFNAEQALQLFLKAKILAKGVEFPKTHEIRKLLDVLSKLENKVLKLSKEEEKITELLEEAYISSRCLPFSFSEEDVEKAIEFVKKVEDFYGKSL